MMRAHLSAVALLLVCTTACSETDMAEGVGAPDALETAQDAQRLDVQPPEDLRSADANASHVALMPQTFRTVSNAGSRDLILVEPVVVSGVVSGFLVTPWQRATLPGEAIALDGALVSVRRTDSVQSANTVTSDGTYSLRIPPGTAYDVSFVPEDPLIPFFSASLSAVDDVVFDIDLGSGVEVWGLVLGGDGAPIEGVAVHAVDGQGIVGGTTLTNADGWYDLRVNPGDYQIVAEGRSNGRDPQQATELLEVGEQGLSVDFQYPTFDLRTLSGRVVDDQGDGLGDVTARFVASSLDGYVEQTTYSVEVTTGDTGVFDTRLLPGVYDVELRPKEGVEFAPATLGERRISASVTDLGTVALAPMGLVSGRVTDPSGQFVPDALVTMTEIGFGQRSWSFVSDDTGGFTTLAPAVRMEFALTPPAAREELALTRIDVEPTQGVQIDVAFENGLPITGRVLYADPQDGQLNPVSYAVVEARDEDGTLWGQALTDAEGTYDLRVRHR
jgi:hypothetical protein